MPKLPMPPPGPDLLMIPGDCDAQTAVLLHRDLQARSAAATAPLRIDLGATGPSAFSLQLALATRRSLEARGTFGGWGPAAAAVFLQDS